MGTLYFDGWYATRDMAEALAAYFKDEGGNVVGIVKDEGGWFGVLYRSTSEIVDWHRVTEEWPVPV